MIYNEQLFSFVTVHPNQISNPNLVTDLLNEKITGILIKGFLDSNENQQLLDAFNSIAQTEKTIINDGFTSYPLSFAQFTQKHLQGTININEYIQIAHKSRIELANRAGFDIVDKLCAYLHTVNDFSIIGPIEHTESKQPLVAFNVRELFPERGELIAHCENLFFTEFPQFFQWLQLMDVKENKLSYFITLQESEEGGELCCFDLNWAEVKQRDNPFTLRDALNNEINLNDNSKVKRHFIKPSAGDLLLFAGGNVWHRVEKVKGTKSRITLGGFIAETNTKGKYYIWS